MDFQNYQIPENYVIPHNLQNNGQIQSPQPASSGSPFVYRSQTGFLDIKPVDEPQPQIPQKINENFIQQQPIHFQPQPPQMPPPHNPVEQNVQLLLLNQIGKGSFGKVYLSKFSNSGENYATKKIDKHMQNDRLKKYFEMEIEILKNLKRFNHPNILKLVQVNQDNNYYYITTEYINGYSLKDCLEEYKKKYLTGFNEKIVQYLMKQILSAMVLLHNLKIIHRDLKLDNIMVNFDNEIDKKGLNMMKAKVKIIDFGCSIIMPKRIPTTYIGTELYMDPNIIEKYYNQALADKNRGYGLEVDIWSLGCICYELNEGKVPFQGETLPEIMRKIKEGKYPLPIYTSIEFRSFLDKMLKYDPKCRLPAKKLINEPFLTKNVNDFHYSLNNFQQVVPSGKPISIGNQYPYENNNGNKINIGFTSLYGDKM